MQMQISSDSIEHISEGVMATGNDEGVIRLKDDRWMITSEGAASVILSAVLVPEESMEIYDRRGYDAVGVKLDKLLKFVKRTDSDMVNIWMEERTLNIEENDGNAHVELATLDIDTVSGRTDKALNINHEVRFQSSFDFIIDFIRQTDDIVNADSFIIGCRNNGLYLYSEYDNARIDNFYEWDEFDDVELDWEVNNYRELGHEPAKDEAIDVILGSDFTKELYHPEDTAHISIGNHFPMRILYETEDGIKISYFQTPRLPKSEDVITIIPERVIEANR